MNSGIANTAIISLCYVSLIFLIAWHAHNRKEAGKSIVNSPYVYTLSIAVYCTSWTYFGSVGLAATTGIDYIMIYLGPSLTVFLWFFVLRRIIRISKENNVTSIADFLSLRYGKSLWLGAIVTIITILAIMPYIALQIKAVSTSFYLICGIDHIKNSLETSFTNIPTGLLLTFILAIFSIIFGARRLISSERHEGLIAAVAFESIVKILSFLMVGVLVTYFIFNGFSDIFNKFNSIYPDDFKRLLTFNTSFKNSQQIPASTLLIMSMGAFMLLPRQFHVMVIENSEIRHINKAMWLFPLYLLIISIFVMPIALGGILITGTTAGADFFVIRLPLLAGNENIAKLAYLGGLSAAAGMVMVESIAISTMLLNHIFMPIIIRFKPQSWFPYLLINLKRLGIILIIFLGYFYYITAGDQLMLANMGLISFTAICQLLPAFLGALFWRRGNRVGAITGIALGMITWIYTLLLPSFTNFQIFQFNFLIDGPFGIALLKPTALLGLTGMDIWSHSLFWSMLFNIGAYVICSVTMFQDELEKDQIRKFFTVFEADRRRSQQSESKRLTKPVTISQFVTLMSKFIGEKDSDIAIKKYLGNRDVDINGHISEFELPNLKRFTEKTLAGSVGAAAAGAIVDGFLSEMGSRLESVYNIFSTVKTSLDLSQESLFVRLKASEIINSTLDIQIIMDDLLALLTKEFELDIVIIQLKEEDGSLVIRSCSDEAYCLIQSNNWLFENTAYCEMVILDGAPHIINDCMIATEEIDLAKTISAGIISSGHIPINRKGEQPIGVISIYSKSIKGLFTEEFIDLLNSLAGQLAQAITIVREIEAKQHERSEKELVMLQNASVKREMEIAQQIQLSLLPDSAPHIPGVELEGRCISATHVGGDYYDFFKTDNNMIDILIADVSGHSVGAALMMAEARTLLRTNVASKNNPDFVLHTLNNQLFDDLSKVDLFISLFYAKYNYETKILSYANAGHNMPIICRSGRQEGIELDADGLIIGVKKDVAFDVHEIELQKEDVILFYTDGLVEASNPQGELFGTNRIYNCLNTFKHDSAKAIIDSLYSEIRTFTTLQALQDDISIIVLKILV